MSTTTAVTPQKLGPDAHGLTRDHVNSAALNVTETLQEAGFAGYLVGGCVRDMLLDHEPKDFDVATDATPEEVRGLFRRSRLVGRRFRIAHVRQGRELIEVSTFRRAHAEDEDERHHSDSGMILRDNVFGSLEEDAFRRDFTINALYYDPHTEEVLDFVGGLEDLKTGRIRFIGDTLTRTREDPVRALRALRFQAKLDFEVDPEIQAAYTEAAEGMANIPPARLFDEMLKLFLSGRGEKTWRALAATPLRAALFPACDPDSPLILRAMRNTDERIRAEKPVTPGFLVAVLLWQDYLARCEELSEELKPAEARGQAMADVIAAQQQHITLPRRFTQFAREVWQLQDRLEGRQARAVPRLAAHQRFRAGYDFLVLRGETGEPVAEQADWWTRYQEVDEETRQSMIDALRETQPKTKKRRRRRGGRKRSGEGNTEPDSDPIECP